MNKSNFDLVEIGNYLKKSQNEFKLNLEGLNILTEAATYNYSVTSVIAALGGAKAVFAIAKDSIYGTIKDILNHVLFLASYLKVQDKIKIIQSINDIDLRNINVVTNSGFVRPIDKNIINKLESGNLILLMYEPWEFRDIDIDLQLCKEKKISVWGINESNRKLNIFYYLGYAVLDILLNNHILPFISKILLIGFPLMIGKIYKILRLNNYKVFKVVDYNFKIDEKFLSKFDSIIVAENIRNNLIIGNSKDSFINVKYIKNDCFVLHIAGNVDFSKVDFKYFPININKFPYMSIRADYLSYKILSRLQFANFKVAQGFFLAKKMGLSVFERKQFIEKYYFGKALNDKDFW